MSGVVDGVLRERMASMGRVLAAYGRLRARLARYRGGLNPLHEEEWVPEAARMCVRDGLAHWSGDYLRPTAKLLRAARR